MRPSFKKPFALVLSALLASQGGFFAAEAVAQTVLTPEGAPLPVNGAPLLEAPLQAAPETPLPLETLTSLELTPLSLETAAAAPLESRSLPLGTARSAVPRAAAALPVGARLRVLSRSLAPARRAPAGPALHAAPLDGKFDGRAERAGDVQAYATTDGRDAVASELNALPAALAGVPGYLDSLNKQGRVRIVVNDKRPGALDAAGVEAVKQRLAAQGVTAPVEVEKIPIDWERKAAGQVSVDAGPGRQAVRPKNLVERLWSGAASFAAAPVRETLYVASALKAAFTQPTRMEVFVGAASKGPAFIASVGWLAKTFLPLHPVAFGAAIAFSLALETFHGVWIGTWQNFQNIIGRQRGVSYQTVFNLVYMQITAALFRLITWTVIAGTIAPWHGAYWEAMSAMVLIGTFGGTLGYQGLNALYNKGAIKRGTRSLVQQGRDVFFLLAGTLLGSGAMNWFWPFFIAQQAIDLTLYVLGSRAKPRPIVYVADAGIAATGEFQGMYPVQKAQSTSALRQAQGAVFGMVKGIVELLKLLVLMAASIIALPALALAMLVLTAYRRLRGKKS